MPGSARSHILVEFKKLDAQMPVLFIANVDPVAREVIQATAEGRKMAFADPAEMSDPETVRQVVAALLPSENDHADISGAIAERDARQAFPHLVPNLRRPNSGRLDARRVADLYGFPLNRLAASVGADPTNVYKTPDAPSLQNKLLIFERIARSLLALVGSEQGLRIWLNTPEPELDGETPRDLLLNGEGEVVAELLEDIREGQPA
jgi:hypothetical protein